MAARLHIGQGCIIIASIREAQMGTPDKGLESMKTLDWKSILSEHPVFSCLTEQQLARLLDSEVSDERSYAGDDPVFKEGDLGDSIFIIGSGEVSIVLCGSTGHQIPISSLGKGEFFGEMALIEGKPRSATAMALEESSLLHVKGPEFLKILRANAELEFKVLFVLSQRLRHLVEHTLRVTLTDMEQKLELFNRKLDSELKVIAAELTASRAVFDQTNTRANEIIIAAERSRTRMTALASTVGAIVALFIAVAGFFGVSQLLDIRDVREEMATNAKAAEENAKAAATDALVIKETKHLLATVDDEIERFRVLRRDVYEQLYIPRFREQVMVELGPAGETYKAVLKIGDAFLIDQLFKSVSGGITSPLENSTKTRAMRDNYRRLLTDGLKKKYAETSREIILSYYLILVSLTFDDDHKLYDETLRDFEQYLSSDEFEQYLNSNKDSEPLKDDLKRGFDPETYVVMIESEAIFPKEDPIVDASEAKKAEMTERILSVWKMIP
jgi:CRP-like cAMP-binding protein